MDPKLGDRSRIVQGTQTPPFRVEIALFSRKLVVRFEASFLISPLLPINLKVRSHYFVFAFGTRRPPLSRSPSPKVALSTSFPRKRESTGLGPDPTHIWLKRRKFDAKREFVLGPDF